MGDETGWVMSVDDSNHEKPRWLSFPGTFILGRIVYALGRFDGMKARWRGTRNHDSHTLHMRSTLAIIYS